MMTTDWKNDGTFFDGCNCEVVCPCIFASAPTEGECTAVIAWHIDKGSYGDVSLDGLNVALALYSPGHILETPWKVALYLDQKANEAQQGALTQIYGGQAGGHMAELGGLIGEVLGVKSASFEYQAEGKRRSLRIDGVGEVEIEGMAGQGGADIVVSNHPVAFAPGYPAIAAKSEKLSYQDYGFNWEFSGKSRYYSPFTYQGP